MGGRQASGRVATAIFAMVALAIVWAGYISLQRARRAADYSCIASVHASLERAGAFRVPDEGRTDWRQWTDAEVGSALLRAEPNDCADRDWWRDDVAIRTRRTTDGAVESELWRKTEPVVSSP
jgi:hypothetical protein